MTDFRNKIIVARMKYPKKDYSVTFLCIEMKIAFACYPEEPNQLATGRFLSWIYGY